MPNKLRIGTRGSKLALWQANYVSAELKNIGIETEIIIIKTKGDLVQNLSFDKIEGKGFFTKEIEDALLNNEVDLAVHSLKDMPTTPVEGLTLSGVSYREKPNDCLIIKKSSVDPQGVLDLKKNPIIGTSSARRQRFILSLIPDAQLKDLRGNVPTRLKKLMEQDYDAILLAAAGLHRLGLDLSAYEVKYLHPREFVPAPGQGVIVYQCRTEDLPNRRIINQIHHPEVVVCTNVERRVLQMLNGGCHVPLGVHCYMDELKNFHAVAAYAKDAHSPVNTIQLSQNTTTDMAETMYNMLMNA